MGKMCIEGRILPEKISQLVSFLISDKEISDNSIKVILTINEEQTSNATTESNLIENKDYEIIITDFIQRLGVPAHIKGYHFIREAILISIKDPDAISHITKYLYPEISKRYNTTPVRVERAIRHAIEAAWSRADIDEINSIFKYTVNSNKGKPTNSEFIALIADKIKLLISSNCENI